MPRLQGWKDIATHLGKSVRTVQRWERDYELPVHRLGKEGGEIIWADPAEIDEWLRTRGLAAVAADQPASAQPAHDTAAAPSSNVPAAAARRRIPTVAWAIGAAAAVVLLAAPFIPWAREQAPGPASWRVSGETFEALSPAGDVLWARSFLGNAAAEAWRVSPQGIPGSQILLADLDDDGRNEVLLLAVDRSEAWPGGLHFIGADGSDLVPPVRPTGTVTFGTELWAGPWRPHRAWAIRDAGGYAIYASFIHANKFPTVLLELDAQGRERGRYWSNGYIRDVRHARFRGEPVVLVGATNNDTRGASLAILPRGRLRGAPPAVNARYRCTSCGDDLPLEFLIFPRRCIAKAIAGQADVVEPQVDEAGQIMAHVAEGPLDPTDGRHTAGAWYTLSPDLRSASVLIGQGIVLEHRRLHQAGTLDHPLGPRDEDDLFPVLRWTGSGFEPLVRGVVRRQGS
jgi:hypothetical protein